MSTIDNYLKWCETQTGYMSGRLVKDSGIFGGNVILVPDVGVFHEDPDSETTLFIYQRPPSRSYADGKDLYDLMPPSEGVSCVHTTLYSPAPPIYIFDGGGFLCPQCAVGRGLKPHRWSSTRLKYTDVTGVTINTALRPRIRQFGIEIEIGFDEKPIREAGYHERRPSTRPFPSLWRAEYDRSIEGINGIELISPPLSNPQYAIGSIVAVVEEAAVQGGFSAPETGIHIHLSRTGLRANRMYAILALLEEFFYAVGAEMVRYMRNRYAPPLKVSGHTSGHYIALNSTRQTFELRLFSGTLSIERIMLNIALAQGLAILAEEEVLPPLTVDADTRIADAVIEQWGIFAEILGWHKGGEWKGWLYDPKAGRRDVTTTMIDGKTYQAALPGEERILTIMNHRVNEFIRDAGSEKVRWA